MTALQFIKALPENERLAFTELRKLIKKYCPQAKEKIAGMMGKEMIQYEVDGKFFAALAPGKSHMSLHLFPLYTDAAFTEKYKPLLKDVKMGKACLNFTTLDKLPMKVVEDMLKEAGATVHN